MACSLPGQQAFPFRCVLWRLIDYDLKGQELVCPSKILLCVRVDRNITKLPLRRVQKHRNQSVRRLLLCSFHSPRASRCSPPSVLPPRRRCGRRRLPPLPGAFSTGRAALSVAHRSLLVHRPPAHPRHSMCRRKEITEKCGGRFSIRSSSSSIGR